MRCHIKVDENGQVIAGRHCRIDINEHCGSRPRKRLFWGVALVALGVGFLLVQQGMIAGFSLAGFGIWHALALLLALSGLGRIVAATRFRHVVKGLGRIAVGGWVIICLEHIWGWTFANSWPALLIIWGAGMLACAATKRRVIVNGESL